jgi:hypothetical protein
MNSWRYPLTVILRYEPEGRASKGDGFDSEPASDHSPENQL